MKQYKAHLTQNDGCDYTIACGHKIINISADTIEEAEEKLIKIIKKDYEEDSLDKAELFEVSNVVKINVKKIYKEIQKEYEKELELEKERHEKEELKRLQNKYGK